MSSQIQTFSLSVNTGIINKPGKDTSVDFARGWKPVECTEGQITESVCGRGVAIAPQYTHGHRKGSNFIRCGFLAADIDRGLTLEEAREHVFVRHHATLIHTTASHTETQPRFRIIFLLDAPIFDPVDWSDALFGLALTLGGDQAATDAARLYYGNSAALSFPIGKTTTPDTVVDLIAKGRAARASRRSKGRMVLPLDSSRAVAGADLVRLANGSTARFDELVVGVSVHCPKHDDTDPSAFTVRSTIGVIGIHCSACYFTFWPNNRRDAYDFNAFGRLFDARREPQVDESASILEQYFPTDPNFVKSQQPFLPRIMYEPGLTLVKSRKGSGKTQALVSLIADIRSGRYGRSVKSILLIGHRRTLIREACRKLKLHCYLDETDLIYETTPDDPLRRTFGVCLDSMPQYVELSPAWMNKSEKKKRHYDLVIIDESEQVIKHLLSDTIKAGAGLERCFNALSHTVGMAKAVIALDADLGLLTTHAMRVMRERDWASNCRIIYNIPVPPARPREMRLFRHRRRLEREVIEAIRLGQRCFIASNSKECVKNLERMIIKACGADVVMRVVTGDNSRDEAVVKFVENITTEFLRVQVVIASPAIGTGIDITFPEGACMVDRVFGFFYPMVNTHTDIDQQLSRVRNPGAVDVWISGMTFNYTCNVDVVKDDLARAYTVKRAVTGLREDGMVEYNRDDPLLTICAHAVALERASKNDLIELFCGLRKSDGWTVIPFDEKSLGSPYDEARNERRAERAELLVNASILTESDFIDLDAQVSKGICLTDEDRAAHEKHRFERTVGVPLDPELVKMNLDGRLLERVGALAEIVSVWASPDPFDRFEYLTAPTKRPKGRLSATPLAMLLGTLMRVAGLTTASGPKIEHEVSAETFAGFARICRENQTMIEEVFKEPMRSDLEKKSVRQMNRFLAKVGLQLVHARTEKRNDRKVRLYWLSKVPTERMLALAASYAVVKRQKEEEMEREREHLLLRLWDRSPQQGTEEKTRI